MASPQAESLASYIKQQLSKGYDINTVKQYLLKYGYQEQLVNEAIQLVSKPKLKISLPNNIILILSVLFLVTVIAASLFFVFSGKQKVSISSSSLLTQADAGEAFDFTIKLGDAKLRAPASLNIDVLSPAGSIVASKKEQIAEVGRDMSFSIILPSSLSTGSYTVRSSVSIKGKKYKTDLYVLVKEKELAGEEKPEEEIPAAREGTCDDRMLNGDEKGIDCGGSCSPCTECPLSCNDNNPCTDETCSFETNYECVYSPVIPCCGNDLCEYPEETESSCPEDCAGFVAPVEVVELTPEQVIEKVKTEDIDPNEAGALCSKLPETRDSDTCFDALAAKEENPIFCLYISSNVTKDSCYMINFALKGTGGEGLCEKVVNSYLRRNCESLQRIASERPDIDFEKISRGEPPTNKTTT